MAESEQNLGSWFGSWIQSAKEKSTTALDFVKRDLAEFTTVLHSDTTKAVSMTRSTISENLKAENATVAKNKMQESFSHLLQGISRALEVIDVPETANGTSEAKTAVYDRAQARLHAVQVDPGTYCNPPTSTEKFIEWLKACDMEDHKGSISELLVSNADIRALYTNLVPTMVSHTEFWHHYFYKIHQLQLDEARKLALMKRADECKVDSFSWDDDEDWSADEETEIVDQKTLAELVNDIEKEEVRLQKPKISDPLPPPAEPERQEETVFRKAVTVEQEIGTVALVEEHFSMPSTEMNVAELHVESEGNLSTPQSAVTSIDCIVDQLKDIPATSCFVNSDPSMNEQMTLFEQQEPEETEKGIVSSNSIGDRLNGNDSVELQVVAPVRATAVIGEDVTPEVDIPVDNSLSVNSSVNSEWKSLSESPVSSVSDVYKPRELKTTCKGDMVVVGSLAGSPSSDASDILKDTASSCPDDEWEQDFDVDITEEDLKKAQEAVKKLTETSPLKELYKTIEEPEVIFWEHHEEEDWESWE